MGPVQASRYISWLPLCKVSECSPKNWGFHQARREVVPLKGRHQPPQLFLFWYYLEYIVSGVRKYHLHDELGHITQSCRIKIIKKYPLKNWNKTIDKYFQWLSPGCALWFFSKSSLSDLEKNDFQPGEPFIAISIKYKYILKNLFLKVCQVVCLDFWKLAHD